MSLLWIDGFENYGVANDHSDSALQKAGYGGFAGFASLPSSSVSSDTRTGIGTSLAISNWLYGGGWIRNFVVTEGLVIGFACKLQVSAFCELVYLGYNNLLGSVATQLRVAANGANGITVVTGDGLHVYASPPNVLFENVWQYIEIKYSPAVGANYLEVRIDGVTVIHVTAGVLITTGAARYVNTLRLQSGGHADWLIDDLYVCDLTGASFNDFLGDCVVHALMPNGDAGPNGMIRTGGDPSGHFTAVDDVPPDGDASYLSSNASGAQEMFTLPAIPADILDVLAIAVNVTARKQAAGLATYTAMVNAGGVEGAGPQFPTSLGYVTQQTIFQAPPSGGAWTVAEAQSATFGVKIV